MLFVWASNSRRRLSGKWEYLSCSSPVRFSLSSTWCCRTITCWWTGNKRKRAMKGRITINCRSDNKARRNISVVFLSIPQMAAWLLNFQHRRQIPHNLIMKHECVRFYYSRQLTQTHSNRKLSKIHWRTRNAGLGKKDTYSEGTGSVCDFPHFYILSPM